MLYDASSDVIWQINSIHFQAPFQQRMRGSGPYRDSCLPDSHSTNLSLTGEYLISLHLGFAKLAKASEKF